MLTCWNTSIDLNCLQNCSLNCFWQNEIDSSAEHNRASTTHCFASRSHSVVTWAGCGPLAKLRIELSPDGKLRLITWRTTMMNHPVRYVPRPINHNNTQHFKGHQRAEQHQLLYKTIKYFNCYNHYWMCAHYKCVYNNNNNNKILVKLLINDIKVAIVSHHCNKRLHYTQVHQTNHTIKLFLGMQQSHLDWNAVKTTSF